MTYFSYQRYAVNYNQRYLCKILNKVELLISYSSNFVFGRDKSIILIYYLSIHLRQFSKNTDTVLYVVYTDRQDDS